MEIPEWARKAIEASAGPPLRDIGGWVACLVAPAMLRWWIDRGEPPQRRTSVTEFRRGIRRGPASSADVTSANTDRAYAWMFIAGGPFLLFVAATFVRRGVPSLAGLAGVVEAVLVAVSMFACGQAIPARRPRSISATARRDPAFGSSPELVLAGRGGRVASWLPRRRGPALVGELKRGAHRIPRTADRPLSCRGASGR